MNNEHISKHSSASFSVEGRGKAAVDYRYLRMARIWAENSYCKRRQVGALDESGVTKPYVLHAEANAITKLARSGNNSEGSTLYVTASPCIECAKLIIQAGIRRVVYAEKYRLTDGIDLLTRAGVEVEYKSLEDGSSSSSASL